MTRHTIYNHGVIRPYRDGVIAEYNRGGSRYRQTFRARTLAESQAQARAWIDAQEVSRANRERPLTVWEYREAQEAIALLPDGMSLLDAARGYLSSVHTLKPVALSAAVEAFLDDKDAANLRPKTLEQYHGDLGRLLTAFSGVQVDTIGTADLMRWLDTRHASGRTRERYRATLQTFFNWCRQRDHVAGNPAQGITRQRHDQVLPGILTVAQVRSLMAATMRLTPDLCAYTALGLWCGIRTAELARLKWSAIGPEQVHIGPDVAKVRQQRFVTLAPTARAWLIAYPGTGLVAPYLGDNLRKHLGRLHVRARISPWPHNAMRHSFGSYHLALHRNAALTAHEMGHSNADMLYRHYRNLVSAENAALYWQITPENVHELSTK